MIVVVTGSVGVGKSTVCKIITKLLKIKYVDADKIGHKILRITNIKKKIRRAFGDDVFVAGRISREKLAEKAFKDCKTINALNSIAHPEINKMLNRKIATSKIIESSAYHGLRLRKKYLLVEVRANKEIVLERIGKDLLKRSAFQESVKGANFIIYNDGTKKELEEEVKKIIEKLK